MRMADILLGVGNIFISVCIFVKVFLNLAICFITDQQYFQEIPICLKIQWLLYNLGANTAIVITISYWSFIFFMEHSSKFFPIKKQTFLLFIT